MKQSMERLKLNRGLSSRSRCILGFLIMAANPAAGEGTTTSQGESFEITAMVPNPVSIIDACTAGTSNARHDSQYWAVCKGDCNLGIDDVYEDSHEFEVLCCADHPTDSFHYHEEVNLFTLPMHKFHEDYMTQTWPMADCICGMHGGRLCAKYEVDDYCDVIEDCTSGTHLVWTETMPEGVSRED